MTRIHIFTFYPAMKNIVLLHYVPTTEKYHPTLRGNKQIMIVLDTLLQRAIPDHVILWKFPIIKAIRGKKIKHEGKLDNNIKENTNSFFRYTETAKKLR